jgi:hypothetical protein
MYALLLEHFVRFHSIMFKDTQDQTTCAKFACRGSTSNAELERIARQHNPNLAEATRLDEKNILERGFDVATDWLQNKQLFGIKGYQWVAIIVTLGTITIAGCCWWQRKTVEKAATVTVQAVSQRLQRVHQTGDITAAFRRKASMPRGNGASQSMSYAEGGRFVPMTPDGGDPYQIPPKQKNGSGHGMPSAAGGHVASMPPGSSDPYHIATESSDPYQIPPKQHRASGTGAP